MAVAAPEPAVARRPLMERLLPDRRLGQVALAMLALVLVALARGFEHWGQVSGRVWLHLLTVLPALALTPVMLIRRKGDAPHRVLGYVWVVCMAVTAASTFALRQINGGRLWWIHILSAYTLVQLPRVVLAARRGDVARHRSGIRAMVLGALLVAGGLTFPFGRLLGRWLVG